MIYGAVRRICSKGTQELETFEDNFHKAFSGSDEVGFAPVSFEDIISGRIRILGRIAINGEYTRVVIH